MAADVKKRRYASYGAPPHASEYDGNAVRRLTQEEVALPRPRVRPRQQAQVRPRVQVREQEGVSVFVVVGFLAVVIFAALVVASYVNLTMISDQTVALRSELSGLQDEEAKLLAKYELAFDLKNIEETVTASGAMVKPQSGQVITVDLSEPDRVVRYEKENAMAGAAGALHATEEVFRTIVEYFR